MAKKKVFPKIEPGSEIVVPCLRRDEGCKEFIILHPSGKGAIPQEVKWTCGSCGGLGVKWKMPAEKAANVRQRVPGQKTLGESIDVEEVEE